MELSFSLYIACLGQMAMIALLGAAAWYGASAISRETCRWDEHLVVATILFLSIGVTLGAGLGVLDLLRPVPVFWSALLLFVFCWQTGHRMERLKSSSLRSDYLFLLRIGVLCAGILALPFLVRSLLIVPVDWDSLTYHLFKPVRWIQEGRILHPLGGAYPYHHLSFFPANNELIIALFMVILRNDLFAEIINLPLIALTGIVTSLLCRRIGGSEEAGWSAGLLVVTTPALLSWGATAYVEPMLNVSMLSALLFTIDALHAEAPQRWRAVILAGLAAGLAVGTKYSALPLAVFLGTVLLLLTLRQGAGWRGTLRIGVLWGGAMLLTGGLWYFLNTLATGNPFYPVPLGSLPAITHPPFPWEDASILSNLKALLSSGWLWEVWIGTPGTGPSRMAVGWKLFLFGPLILLGLGSLFGKGISQLQTGTYRDGMVRLLVLCTACLLGYTYLILPFYKNLGWLQSNVRFLLPFICVGTAAGMAWLSRTGVAPRSLFLLVFGGMALDAQFLDLSLPGLSIAMGRMVLVAIAMLGMSMLWLKKPVLDSRTLRDITLSILLVLPALLLSYREGLRYHHYQVAEEVHPSQHLLFARAAHFLQVREPEKTLAVAAAGPLEFLYLFVGPRFERRVLYVETHAGPDSLSPNPTGDPRFAFDRAAWIQNMLKAQAELLLVMRWIPEMDWPPEYRWAWELQFPLIYQDDYTAIFTVPLSSAEINHLEARSRVVP